MTQPAERLRVTVIGAGIVGVCCASYLQRDGHDVEIIDMVPPGEQCSFGNAGAISPGSCVPLAMPGVLSQVPKWLLDQEGPLFIRLAHLPQVLPWLIRFVAASRRDRVVELSRHMRALHRLTFECYEPLVRDAGCGELIERRGQLLLYQSAAGLAKDGFGLELRRQNGVKVEILESHELRQLEPALAPIFSHAVFLPEQGQCRDPSALVKRLAEHVVRNGGRLRQARVTGIELGSDGPRALRTDGGVLPVDRLVIAAGAWSGGLAAQLGSPVPLESQRGYHVTIPDPGVAPRIQAMWTERKFVSNPMAMGLRLAGTVEFAGLKAPPNMRRARALLAHGGIMYPGLRGAGATNWMGHRPCLPDTIPVIGRSPRHRNLFFAFGHGHTGMIGGSVTGRLIADIVADRPPAIDINPYRIDRF